MNGKLDNEDMLVEQMQAGSDDAFTQLYDYYSPRLYVKIIRIIHNAEVTEEIVQELFIKIWQKREFIGFKENFGGYVYRIAQNLIHDYFRKVKKDKKLYEKFCADLTQKAYDHIEETVFYHESTAILSNAVKYLSPQQKKVYQFVKEEDYTYKQVAELMGISPQTVKEYLISATKFIKKYIINYSNNEHVILLIIIALQILKNSFF